MYEKLPKFYPNKLWNTLYTYIEYNLIQNLVNTLYTSEINWFKKNYKFIKKLSRELYLKNNIKCLN